MRHLAITLLFFCLCSTRCISQDQQVAPYKHAMSIELLGAGGYGSINYEHFFNQKEKRFLAYRVGLGFAPKNIFESEGVNVGLPHGITVNFGKKNNFETGIYGNLLFTPGESQNSIYYGGPMIGYRRQTTKGLFRIFVAYYYVGGPESGFFTNAGLAFGFPFRKRDR